MLLATNTWEEAGHKGPITFGEDTESLSGTCQALDHSPAPRAQAAPQGASCLLSSAKLLPTSTRGTPNMRCLLEQYTYSSGGHTWVV